MSITGQISKLTAPFLLATTLTVNATQAQEIEATPLKVETQAPYAFSDDSSRTNELEQWLKDYEKWKNWNEKHYNRFSYSNKRMTRPQEPIWLRAECDSYLEYDTSLVSVACLYLREEKGDIGASWIRQQIEQKIKEKEAVEHTSFWELIHLAGGWPRTTFNSDKHANKNNAIYGILGMHVGIPFPGYNKLQLIIPPSAMGFSVPTSEGRKIYFASYIGAAYKLTDFAFNGQKASLHINIARAFFFKNRGYGSGIDVGGLSITFSDGK